MSHLEERFAVLLSDEGLPPGEPIVFCPGRRFRYDFAWEDVKLAVEIHGGSFGGKVIQCNHCHNKVSRKTKTGKISYVRETFAHNTGPGMRNNLEKMNIAQRLGWIVLAYDTTQITAEYAREVADVYHARKAALESGSGKIDVDKQLELIQEDYAKRTVSRKRAKGRKAGGATRRRTGNDRKGWEEVFRSQEGSKIQGRGSGS